MRTSMFLSPVGMVLLLISGVIGVSFLSDGALAVRAEKQPQIDSLHVKSVLPEDRVWRENIGKSETTGAVQRLQRTLRLNATEQKALLRRAPMEFTKAARHTQVVMTLPMPNGTFARFRVEESPVMAPGLAARFPEIKTYRGRGVDDPAATTRFAVTPAGFHAIVLSTQGTFIIEPASTGNTEQYVSYEQQDELKDAGSSSCVVFGPSSRWPSRPVNNIRP